MSCARLRPCSEVLSLEECAAADVVCLVRRGVEVIADREEDVGVAGPHLRDGGEAGSVARVVIARRMEYVVSHERDAHPSAQQLLAGCQVEVAVGLLASLGEYLRAYDMRIELKLGSPCHTEDVGPVDEVLPSVIVGAYLAMTAEAVVEDAAAQVAVPPARGL